MKDQGKEQHLGGGPPWVHWSAFKLAHRPVAEKKDQLHETPLPLKVFDILYSVEGRTSLIMMSMPR